MSSPCRTASALALGPVLALCACQRETRDYHGPAPSVSAQAGVSPTTLHVGGAPQPSAKDPGAAVYEKNAFHISEGKRYYEWFNCYGCHAAGGGDIGPPLMDADWRYGGEIEQIHASIVEGRPNGMPGFGGRIPDQQVWEIAAYIRSMGGNVAKDAAPSRGDEMQTGEPKVQIDPTPPRPIAPTDQPGP
ncbi:MAG: cytochrome c class [Caulobacteraceae bacterium]|nr:cytochrome c class [Caulobacteraceae bacterium]